MDTKNFLKSKTILGGLAMLAGFVMQSMGGETTPDEVAALSDKMYQAAVLVSEIGGFFFVLYGRFKAKKQLVVLK